MSCCCACFAPYWPAFFRVSIQNPGLKQTLLRNLWPGILLLAKRWQRYQLPHTSIKFGADSRRMLFKRAMTESVDSNTLLIPVSKPSCPFIQEWLVYFHIWISNVAHKGEIATQGNTQ